MMLYGRAWKGKAREAELKEGWAEEGDATRITCMKEISSNNQVFSKMIAIFVS